MDFVENEVVSISKNAALVDGQKKYLTIKKLNNELPEEFKSHFEEIRKILLKRAESHGLFLKGEEDFYDKNSSNSIAVKDCFDVIAKIKVDEEIEKIVESTNEVKIPGVTHKWTYEVKVEDSIPREYMSPNHMKIKAAIAEGKRNIEGINIFQEKGVSLR
jgi:hypothetical protein